MTCPAVPRRKECSTTKDEFAVYRMLLIGQESVKDKGILTGKRDCSKQSFIERGWGGPMLLAGGCGQAVLL